MRHEIRPLLTESTINQENLFGVTNSDDLSCAAAALTCRTWQAVAKKRDTYTNRILAVNSRPKETNHFWGSKPVTRLRLG